MAWHDAMLGALRAYDPKVAEDAMAQLAEMEKEIGFNMRDDLFGAIGDSVVTWAMPMTDITGSPEMAILINGDFQSVGFSSRQDLIRVMIK